MEKPSIEEIFEAQGPDSETFSEDYQVSRSSDSSSTGRKGSVTFSSIMVSEESKSNCNDVETGCRMRGRKGSSASQIGPECLESTREEKVNTSKRHLVIVGTLTYGIFIFVSSIILFVGNAVIRQHPLSEIFLLCLLGIGFLYFIFLIIRVRMHISKERKIKNSSETRHPYCFLTGRHAEIVYLKFGATCFCLGLIIHAFLLLSYEVFFLMTENPDFMECAKLSVAILQIAFPIYSLFILFIIFKYNNLIINEFRGLARFGLMHAIVTSLSFWIFTIVRETEDAIDYKIAHSPNNPDHLRYHSCPESVELNTVIKDFSPYFYPFVIEFCILTGGIFFTMWANIGQCQKGELHCEIPGDFDSATVVSGASSTSAHQPNNRSNNIISIDCHASHRGLFAGNILIVVTIVVVILLFLTVSEEKYEDLGKDLDSAYEIIVFSIMILVAIIGFSQTSKLDVNTHYSSFSDDVLLFISVPAYFCSAIFSLIPAAYYLSIPNILVAILPTVETLVQTPWIIDGLRRCANSPSNRSKKPGRELVFFMAIANVACWLFRTFYVKYTHCEDEIYTFYGPTLGTILSHLTLPLIMFYRFHSSVCLIDIWRHSYESSRD